MKKKTVRRLSLSRETVSVLADDHVSQVAGGLTSSLNGCTVPETLAYTNCYECPSNPLVCEPAMSLDC